MTASNGAGASETVQRLGTVAVVDATQQRATRGVDGFAVLSLLAAVGAATIVGLFWTDAIDSGFWVYLALTAAAVGCGVIGTIRSRRTRSSFSLAVAMCGFAIGVVVAMPTVAVAVGYVLFGSD
jgi:small basic protein